MDDEVVARFQRLFRGHEGAHGLWTPDREGRKLRAVTRREPAPEKRWHDHLAGRGSYLGVIPLRDDNTCYWGAIDLDDPDTDHQLLARRVEAARLPLVVCRSKSGGAHLLCFFLEPLPARDINKALREWAEALELTNPQDDKGRVRSLEVFPKQGRLGPGQVGNWLNLPYWGGDKSQRYAVDARGKRYSLLEFLELAESRRLTAGELAATRPELGPEHPNYFADGPPCLATLHQQGGLPDGSRNNGLYNVGIFLGLKYPDDWQDRLREYNDAAVSPPLPDEELDTLIGSLERHKYVYRCNDVPLVDVCERTKCQKQRWGISVFAKRAAQQLMPNLGPLAYIPTDPPTWTLEVDGIPVDLSTEDLLNIQRLRQAVLARCRKVLPMLKAADWDDHLRTLLDTATEVDVPDDAGRRGQLWQRVLRFLHLRRKATSQDALLEGLPWEANDKVYFRSSDLIDWLDRERFRELRGVSELWIALRAHGVNHTVLHVKGARVDCWWLPVPTGEQSEELDTPVDDQPNF